MNIDSILDSKLKEMGFSIKEGSKLYFRYISIFCFQCKSYAKHMQIFDERKSEEEWVVSCSECQRRKAREKQKPRRKLPTMRPNWMASYENY